MGKLGEKAWLYMKCCKSEYKSITTYSIKKQRYKALIKAQSNYKIALNNVKEAHRIYQKAHDECIEAEIAYKKSEAELKPPNKF